jgi:hypothetical protein
MSDNENLLPLLPLLLALPALDPPAAAVAFAPPLLLLPASFS